MGTSRKTSLFRLGMLFMLTVIFMAGCGKGGDRKTTPTPTLPPTQMAEPTDEPDEPEENDPTPTPTDYPKRPEVTYGEDPELYKLYETAYDYGQEHNANIYIADLVPDEVLQFMDAERQTNYFKVYKTLNEIDRALDVYPKEMFMNAQGETWMNVYIVAHCENFYSAIFAVAYDETGEGWEGMIVQCDEEDMWDDLEYQFHYSMGWVLCDYMDYYKEFCGLDSPFDPQKWLSFMPKGFAYLNDATDQDKINAYGEKYYPDYLRKYISVIDNVYDRECVWADLLANTEGDYVPELKEPYIRKMGYLIDCVRQLYERRGLAFPEKTAYEAMYERICEKAGVKPGWK